MTASQQRKLRKTLYDHDWTTLEEWAKNLDELAELDDHDIEKLLDIAVNDRDEDLCA
ncbi:MAG: hypothetical protein KIT00_12975 [Rhodospirillales bacterium]|nr:hypothetical protein [Rhodospirillales bacterium]